MGRSKLGPSLRTSAGARFTTMRKVEGNLNCELRVATRTRSPASRTAVSGKPTMRYFASPGAVSTCTCTEKASMPRIAAESN
ncbi:MAG: hypothetical protein BWY76_03247 [bacterium ADurb.Bin429]|nr:MAG: hypothetical protein BWY76_03247 [bacterium ADurb.Bin429]